MNPLDKTLRNGLERTVKEAREVAENAARAALEQLGVGEAAPFGHLSEQDRELRRKLRVQAGVFTIQNNRGGAQRADHDQRQQSNKRLSHMIFPFSGSSARLL